MTITVTNSATAIMACGGLRDPKGIASALSACSGLTWQLVTGGGVLAAQTMNVVQDGQTVTLVAAPADLTLVGVISASEAAPVTINAGAGDTILGSANIKTTRTLGLKYASGTKIWSALT